MSDFCMQCSVKIFGDDSKDLANISTPKDTEAGIYASVLCEGCGHIFVNHLGRRVGFGSCNKRFVKETGFDDEE